jgi:hypothetical protein
MLSSSLTLLEITTRYISLSLVTQQTQPGEGPLVDVREATEGVFDAAPQAAATDELAADPVDHETTVAEPRHLRARAQTCCGLLGRPGHLDGVGEGTQSRPAPTQLAVPALALSIPRLSMLPI